MTRHYTDYNDTIKLRYRDIGDIVDKAMQSGCRYYMQLNLQGRNVWVGFNEAFESGIDRLYSLYYKIPMEDGVIRVCVGLFRSSPSHDAVYLQLMGTSNIPDPMINAAIVHSFLQIKETKHIELRRPTYVSNSPIFEAPIFMSKN